MKIDMILATRLAQEGRLNEAMAVLCGARTAAPPSNFAGDALQDQSVRSPSTMDMLPSSTSKGAWRSAPFDGAHSTGARQQQLPETLRRLLDRFGQFNVADGLGADAGSVPLVPDGARFKSTPTRMGQVAGTTSSSSQAATLDRRCRCL